MDIKHIFFAIHEYSGANTYAEQLRTFLIGREDVRFYIIHFGSLLYQEFTVVEKEETTFFHFPFPGKRDLNIYSRRAVDLLIPWLKDKKNLILHLNSPNQHFLGQYIKERFGAKVVFTIHFLMSYYTSCPEGYTYENDPFQDKTGNKETILLADRVVCVTKFAQRVTELYFHKEKERVLTIYNGYGKKEQIKLIPEYRKKALKEKLGFAEDEIILLYVGRIDETKGCEKLIQAMELLVRKHKRIRLIFAGGGNYGACLKYVGLNCARVIFAGHLSAEDLNKLYRIADIGIIPSLWEQCSYVAIEMMAHGLPVVYSGVPGLRELFIDGVNGKQIPFYRDQSKYRLRVDSKDIAEVLAKLISHPKATKKLGQQARKTWEQQFTNVIMGHKVLELYRELLFFEAEEKKEDMRLDNVKMA